MLNAFFRAVTVSAFLSTTAVAFSLIPAPSPAFAQTTPTSQTGVIIAGSARFTVITPECIRIEGKGADSNGFVDAPSLFAANRQARFTGYKVQRNGNTTTIDTGVIRLTYTADGKPLGTSNLKAAIHKGAIKANWTPGAPNPGNLGGTVRTLDGWNGAQSLGEGIISRDGWYLLDDSKSPLMTTDWVQSRPKTAGTDWYLFGYGDDYRSALKSLTTIGGPIPMPRKYLLGSWYSRFWPYTADDYRQIVAEYTSHDFPLDNMVLDMDWHKDGWTGWSWNRPLLPDPPALLTWFHQQGLHVTLNVHPADGVGPQEDAYAQFMKDMGADPASNKALPFDAGDKKYLDTLFQDVHDPLTKDGVDFWWLDWQQYPFTRSIPDLTNLAWLNHSYYNYTAKGGQRGVSFSRWAGWGDHRYPIHFSGDANTSWKMLAFEVPMTATAGNVGCFFWSHDIGGHQGGRNEESYTRWCQFGALTAALRSHSTRDKNMDRRPWGYPDWAETSMRGSFHLRAELFPYIYSSTAQAARDSVPLNRPLYFDYPGDENAYHNGQEFLFGDDLLAAPITSPGIGPRRVGKQVVYFPKGTWDNIFTGERYVGPTEALVAADIDEMPLYVRAGVPLPLQPYTPRMATTPLATLRVRCTPGPDGTTQKSTLYEDDGVSDAYKTGASATTPLSYTRKGREVTVRIGAATGNYKGQLPQRAYRIELPDTVQPARVTVNGTPVAFDYDHTAFETRISLPPLPREQEIAVQVVFPGDLIQKALHLAAIQRRVAGITGVSVNELDEKQILAHTIEISDPRLREAVLAACGVGIFNKNQAPYLYRGTNNLTFYAPSDLLDDRKVQKIPADPALPLPAPVKADGKAPVLLGSSATTQSADRAVGVRFQVGKVPFELIDRSFVYGNVAPLAKITVNGTEGGYNPSGLTDGVVEGYPENYQAEWASSTATGAFVTLTWATPQTVDRILLYDRPNAVDQITAGKITFSDGTTLDVGPLPNDGQTPVELKFPAKTITSLKLEITGVREGTEHAGLSEILVLKAATRQAP